MAKATKTIKQPLSYKSAHSCYVATTKTLFKQVAAFYFEVIGEQDTAVLWAKIGALDVGSAHQVSHRIVLLAKEHQARMLLFEHLGHFKPPKGTAQDAPVRMVPAVSGSAYQLRVFSKS